MNFQDYKNSTMACFVKYFWHISYGKLPLEPFNSRYLGLRERRNLRGDHAFGEVIRNFMSASNGYYGELTPSELGDSRLNFMKRVRYE